MNLKSLFIPLALLAGFAALPATSFGQGPAQRIAVADPGRIFGEMQETKDLKENLESERVRLIAMEKEKKDEIQKLQQQRNQLKPDTPQWDELNNKLMDAALEFQLWGQQTKLKAERNQKRQVKQLFQRIEQAVGEVAQRDGYDLVISDQRPALPDDLDTIPYEQLLGRINSRNVLYAGPKANISDAVLALLDAKYKGRGGNGGVATPTTPPTAAKKSAAPAPK